MLFHENSCLTIYYLLFLALTGILCVQSKKLQHSSKCNQPRSRDPPDKLTDRKTLPLYIERLFELIKWERCWVWWPRKLNEQINGQINAQCNYIILVGGEHIARISGMLLLSLLREFVVGEAIVVYKNKAEPGKAGGAKNGS